MYKKLLFFTVIFMTLYTTSCGAKLNPLDNTSLSHVTVNSIYYYGSSNKLVVFCCTLWNNQEKIFKKKHLVFNVNKLFIYQNYYFKTYKIILKKNNNNSEQKSISISYIDKISKKYKHVYKIKLVTKNNFIIFKTKIVNIK